MIVDSVGSYLMLEIANRNDSHFHPNAILLNTGRNALEYILKSRCYKIVYLPHLYCSALLTPFNRLDIEYRFYNINKEFLPVFNFDELEEDDGFLYINYYGQKDTFVKELSSKIGKNLIVDNTHAFYSKPINGIPTFYSLRKFFGIPDGAMLCNIEDTLTIGQDKSSDRIMHLIKRHEEEPEVAYSYYASIEANFDSLPIKRMSVLTQKLLLSINYEQHKIKRDSNFHYLNDNLHQVNNIRIKKINGPISYPLWTSKGSELREYLKANRVFLPIFWPNVIKESPPTTTEYDMAKNILPIPVDSRYNEESLKRVVDLILNF